VEHVSIRSIMAIQAPSVFLIMLEFDIIVEFFQLSSLGISLHIRVTRRAGEDILAKGRRGHLDVLLPFFVGLLEAFIEG